MTGLSALLGALGRLLAPVAAFLLPWWAGRTAARADAAERALGAERERDRDRATIARLSDADLDRGLDRLR